MYGGGLVPLRRGWEWGDYISRPSSYHLPWRHYAYISLQCQQKRFQADNALKAGGTKMRLEIRSPPFYPQPNEVNITFIGPAASKLLSDERILVVAKDEQVPPFGGI